MTEFEQQLLQHLQKQAEQLTALSSHQEATSKNLSALQTTVGQVLEALSKEPSGESLEATLKAALQPLNSNLEQLIESFNKLSNFSQQLSEQLPPQQKK